MDEVSFQACRRAGLVGSWIHLVLISLVPESQVETDILCKLMNPHIGSLTQAVSAIK